jgi:glucose/arabinose dehydrogenase
MRNPTTLAFHPTTGELYAGVQERDGLGDNLPPDYLTHVEKGAFYGWPYAYIGPKPQWEFPRLCRGGSKSLTYPAVDTAAPSTKLRIASRQAHEEGFD